MFFVTILTTYSNGFFGISYAQFLPYFAQEVLRVGPSGYGLLVSAPGVGAVLISFFLSTHTRLSGMRRIVGRRELDFLRGYFSFCALALSCAVRRAARGDRLHADELSGAGAGDYSGRMSAPSSWARHEFVLSRPRLWLPRRDHTSVVWRRWCRFPWRWLRARWPPVLFRGATAQGRAPPRRFRLIDCRVHLIILTFAPWMRLCSNLGLFF